MPQRHIRRVLIALLLCLHVWLAVGGGNRVGLAYDEPAHIVAGLYQHTGDFRFQPENGTLPQRIEALPWRLAGVDVPATAGPGWDNADVWFLGEQLFDKAGAKAETLLFWSRLTTALAGAALLGLLYLWTAAIFGPTGGLVALGFAALCPNLLAHAGLATTDTWGTLGFFAATLTLWRLCHRITPSRILLAGTAAGLFALCKFSVLLLPPVAVLLIALRLLHCAELPWAAFGKAGRLPGWRRAPVLFGSGLLAAGVSVLVIWAGFGFRFSATEQTSPEARFAMPFERVLLVAPMVIRTERLGESADTRDIPISAGAAEKGLAWVRQHRLLPEAWIYGCAFVIHHTKARKSYFAGDYHERGRMDFFPMALLLKTPAPGILALLAGACACGCLCQWRRRLYRLGPVLALVAVALASAMFSNVNIGLRHILPVVAALWICTGALGAPVPTLRARRAKLLLALVLIVAQGVVTLRQFPHHLTFFNSLAGDHPDHWFVDSNLDWGQGLPELKRWLDQRDDDLPVFLSYFGTDSPKRHGIKATRLADFNMDREPRVLPARLLPGWYCFGPTQYRRAYGKLRGNWTLGREAHYQAIRARVAELAITPDTLSPEARALLLEDLELLHFARLGHYLSGRHPDHRLPGGMMVFRLEKADLDIALHAPLTVLNGIIAERLSKRPLK